MRQVSRMSHEGRSENRACHRHPLLTLVSLDRTNVVRDTSNSRGPERDLLCGGLTACLLWCLPSFAFALGFLQPLPLRTVLWTMSLAFMGVSCLVNASRCGRVHCYFTGPFFILVAVASLGYGLGFLPFGPSGWELKSRKTLFLAKGGSGLPSSLNGTK